jgi:hypothetical protein
VGVRLKKISFILLHKMEGGVESKLICTKVLIIQTYKIMCYDLNQIAGGREEDWVKTKIYH